MSIANWHMCMTTCMCFVFDDIITESWLSWYMYIVPGVLLCVISNEGRMLCRSKGTLAHECLQ